MNHTSHLELSESALAKNVAFIRSLLGQNNYSAVVKGNAYGHNVSMICPMLYENGVRHFSVFSANEAYSVQQALPGDVTIMVMGYLDDTHLRWAIEHGIEFFVFDEGRLQAAAKAAEEVGKPALLHVEVETGMNRTGFVASKLDAVIEDIRRQPELMKLQGICSHLAGAESMVNYDRVDTQYNRFLSIQQGIKKTGTVQPTFHLACSAASVLYPKAHFDLTRIGILQYGFFPSREVEAQYLSQHGKRANPLERVISWKTRIMDIKAVAAGEYVGYGNSYCTNIDTLIALIPVGYSHGFSRSLSNHGKVLIRGQRFDVVGMVNMSMMAVDVSSMPGVEVGDEVVLIGQQGDREITVSSFSEFSDLVNYELLTRLPFDIPRERVA